MNVTFRSSGGPVGAVVHVCVREVKRTFLYLI